MLDAIVDIKIAQVECVLPVISAEHVRCKIRDEKAETWGKVVRLANFRVQLPEANTAPRVW